MLRKVPNSADQLNRPTLQGLRREMHSRLARGHPWMGDATMTRLRLTSGGRRSHDSPEATIGRETQSHLARGQPRAGEAVMTRPRLASGERRSHGSPEANPEQATHFRLARMHLRRCSGRCPTPPTNSVDQLCKAPGARGSHDSPEATPGRETQSRLARGQPRVGDIVTTRPRPTTGG
jgi:hypothetical protein